MYMTLCSLPLEMLTQYSRAPLCLNFEHLNTISLHDDSAITLLTFHMNPTLYINVPITQNITQKSLLCLSSITSLLQVLHGFSMSNGVALMSITVCFSLFNCKYMELSWSISLLSPNCNALHLI